MAYFSNGTEGMAYEAQYCERCVHFGDEDNGCPILGLHFAWNYQACNGRSQPADSPAHIKWVALETLIPRTKDGLGNEQCKFFVRGNPEEVANAELDRKKLEEWNALYQGKVIDRAVEQVKLAEENSKFRN